MINNILEKILEDILLEYMDLDESTIDSLIQQPTIKQKERIGTIKNLKIIIYSNDHNPPHFHVLSNDYNVNAKFLIENGEFLSGEISAKDLKRIKAFYLSPKTKIIMEKVWNKKNSH